LWTSTNARRPDGAPPATVPPVPAGEDHYVLSPPDTIERCARGRVRRLPRAFWADLGAGRSAASAALLTDATCGPVRPRLVTAFVRDVLAPLSGREPVVIAVREVRAWRAEREPELRRERARRAREGTTLLDLLAERDRALAGPPLAGWLEVFRAVHGPPRTDVRTHHTEEAG
jgi:hypothetical protein